METWSAHQLYQNASKEHDDYTARALRAYAQNLRAQGLPVIFTLGHLSKITGVSYAMLKESVNRQREASNYRMYAVKKRSGGRRFIHSVSTDLFRVQQFINQFILQSRAPHSSSFAFHGSGGIRKCAEQHCEAKWLFQYDLKDFFYDVTEIDVFRIFQSMGYRNLLAFELARLCTTTHLPKWQKRLLFHHGESSGDGPVLPYHDRTGVIGVLPQGAPTSPMLSNLAARELDELLQEYATENGFTYTRYADDLTFSTAGLGRLSVTSVDRAIVHRIRKARFRENEKKTRVARPGSKKLVLGLLVDCGVPRISKETYKKIDSHLHAVPIYGWEATARHWGFDSAFGFFNHLSGWIAFIKDVDALRWQDFVTRFAKLPVPSWYQRE